MCGRSEQQSRQGPFELAVYISSGSITSRSAFSLAAALTPTTGHMGPPARRQDSHNCIQREGHPM